MSESSPPQPQPPPTPADLQRRSLLSLDWPILVDALTLRAATRCGAELCAELPLLESAHDAGQALQDVREAMTLLLQEVPLPLGGIEDLRAALRAARIGELLDGGDLLRVAHCLEALERVHRHLDEQADSAPRLRARAQAIRPMPELAARLVSSFDSRGELSTTAYPQLATLRGRKAQLHSRIRSTLEDLARGERWEGVLQDDFLALRNDRYVLPVKAQARGAGLGIVHDASGSGQTVFVEPFEVVELNNDLKLADAELAAEERRILRDLTERVALAAGDIARALETAAALDFVQSKALLGRDLGASPPEIDEKPVLVLQGARHPLLLLRGVEVIPNDLRLGEGARALVLSGPNAGGKTVLLKTLGLFALMLRAGLPVPAEPGTRIGWFPRVLTDIGDLQDVQGDLSTFSGHVLRMVEVLRALDEDGGSPGLVLIDEIAVGTDPVQGAALGRAVLEALLSRRTLLATTTHYPELKALSAADERFLNGRFEFDAEEGRPTYRLSPGRPGSSHALEVAARVGLPPEVVARARGLLDATTARVEDLLSRLESEAQEARKQREQAGAARAEAERELAVLRRERDAQRRREKEFELELRADFERELRGYRETARGAMRQLREAEDLATAERARQRLLESGGAARGRLDARFGAAGEEGAADRLVPEEVKVGARVRVASLGREGVVASEPDGRGRLYVEVGGRRVQVAAADLERAREGGGGRGAGEAERQREPGMRGGASLPAASGGPEHAWRGPDTTLDLRGERVDDALDRVDQFLDGARMAGRDYVFVLHGHGTGALKEAVRRHLGGSPYVSRWTPASRAQGGDGVTVVELSAGGGQD